MNVKSMLLKPLSGALLSGELSLVLELSSGAWHIQALDLAELVCQELKRAKALFAVLTGEVESQENLDAAEFIQALYVQGFIPVLACSGQVAPTWLSLIKTRIVEISRPSWLKYSVSELIYSPVKPPAEDPELDPALHGSTSFVLNLSGFFSKTAAVEFLLASKIHWKFYSVPRVNLTVNLTEKLPKIERKV